MYQVLKEIKRVIKKDGKAFLILGDSAPYGVFIPTTKVLGKIAQNVGFDKFEIQRIRTRGTKWKSLTYRHSIELSENVLVLS
jgi:ubiquinone/menaquinone biosynthesis C-methylase UbiE